VPSTKPEQLCEYLSELLNAHQIQDYCPNGLQVEGRRPINRLVSGVTASQALIEAAIAKQADAILAHHGYFWRGEAAPVVGIKANRLRALLGADISLLCYHLPLDAHPKYGNNATLGVRLGLQEPRAHDDGLMWTGSLSESMTGAALRDLIAARLNREPVHIAPVALAADKIERVAWCSGGAQGHIGRAIDLGVQAYISGEISEATVHLAREGGIHYFAAGHHATERYGVQALGCHLAAEFGIEHCFVDIDNPA